MSCRFVRFAHVIRKCSQTASSVESNFHLVSANFNFPEYKNSADWWSFLFRLCILIVFYNTSINSPKTEKLCRLIILFSFVYVFSSCRNATSSMNCGTIIDEGMYGNDHWMGSNGMIGVSGLPPTLEADTETAEDGRWTCHSCTFHNHELLETCEECEMPRLRLGTADTSRFNIPFQASYDEGPIPALDLTAYPQTDSVAQLPAGQLPCYNVPATLPSLPNS